MSKLTDLLSQVERKDPQLATDLKREYKALSSRRAFGLNFERHHPESTEIPGRKARKGEKVRVLPPRGSLDPVNKTLWIVEHIDRADGGRVAHLVEHDVAEPETRVANVDDLVVVAVFRDSLCPGLACTGKVERGGDKPFHSVINGENFHVLQSLTYTHKGKIDAIYIDPPYNTGAKDWKYNDDYVKGDDLNRHSKWLAFMERRLLVAKALLNQKDSLLIVTIDEKEVHRLALLLEQVFPECRIQMVSSVISQKGVHRDIGMNRVDEYIFYIFLGVATLTRQDPVFTGHARAATRTQIWYPMLRTGTDASRDHSPGCFYPVIMDPSTGRVVACGDALKRGIPHETYAAPNGLEAIFPIASDGTEGRWQVSPNVFRPLLSEGMIKLGRVDQAGNRSVMYIRSEMANKIRSGEVLSDGLDENGVLKVSAFEGSQEQGARTQWNNVFHDAALYGSNLVKQIIPGRKFPFPKSLYAVEDALRWYLKPKKQATILDFFSGSGTTAHAVMRLNRQDGGRRQCISVTNNEVAADEQKALRKAGLRPGDPEWEQQGTYNFITRPRIEAAITGRTPQGDPIKGDYKSVDEFPMSEGFEENARFFELTYETRTEVAHNEAFRQVAPLLWLRAGARGACINTEPDAGWAVTEAYGILVDLDASTAFVEAIRAASDIGVVYIVTDDKRRFQAVARRLPESMEVVRLYESYVSSFHIRDES